MRLCSTSSPARRSISARGISESSEIGIVIELPPAHGIEVAEQTAGIVVPAPPQVARQRPQALLRRSDEAVQGARFADDRSHLGSGLAQHANFIFPKDTGRDGLHYQHALQHAAVDQRNAEKRLVSLFAGFAEIFEAWMFLYLLDRDRPHLFRDQTREAFVQPHAQSADALRAKSHARGQHQIGAVGFQQISGADVGLKTLGDQSHNVHQGFRGLAALGGEIGDFLQGQNVIMILRRGGLTHV